MRKFDEVFFCQIRPTGNSSPSTEIPLVTFSYSSLDNLNAEMAKKFSNTTMYFSAAKLLIIFVEANLLQVVAGKFDVLSFYSEVDLSFENFENCHSPQWKLDVSY